MVNMHLSLSAKVLAISFLVLVVCLLFTGVFSSVIINDVISVIGVSSFVVFLGTLIFKGRHTIVREFGNSIRGMEQRANERREYDRIRSQRSREIYLDEVARGKAIRNMGRAEAADRRAERDKAEYYNHIKNLNTPPAQRPKGYKRTHLEELIEDE
jgi:hypothetical protein